MCIECVFDYFKISYGLGGQFPKITWAKGTNDYVESFADALNAMGTPSLLTISPSRSPGNACVSLFVNHKNELPRSCG